MGRTTGPFVRLHLSQCSEEERDEMRSRYEEPREEVISLERTLARRIDRDALFDALGSCQKAQEAVIYICGPPRMTDEIEQVYLNEGFPKSHVLTEKWW